MESTGPLQRVDVAAQRSFLVRQAAASIGNHEHAVAEEQRDPDVGGCETEYGATVRHDYLPSWDSVSARATVESPMQLGREGFSYSRGAMYGGINGRIFTHIARDRGLSRSSESCAARHPYCSR